MKRAEPAEAVHYLKVTPLRIQEDLWTLSQKNENNVFSLKLQVSTRTGVHKNQSITKLLGSQRPRVKISKRTFMASQGTVVLFSIQEKSSYQKVKLMNQIL